MLKKIVLLTAVLAVSASAFPMYYTFQGLIRYIEPLSPPLPAEFYLANPWLVVDGPVSYVVEIDTERLAYSVFPDGTVQWHPEEEDGVRFFYIDLIAGKEYLASPAPLLGEYHSGRTNPTIASLGNLAGYGTFPFGDFPTCYYSDFNLGWWTHSLNILPADRVQDISVGSRSYFIVFGPPIFYGQLTVTSVSDVNPIAEPTPPQMALTSAHVAECVPTHVFVKLTNDQPVQAFSLGVAHDPAVATLAAIDFAECPALAALNGGQGPDYFGVDLNPGTSHCSPEITAGGTVYCIGSETEPDTMTIPAGTDQPIVHLAYEAMPGNPVGTEAALAIVDCLGGELPRDVVLTIESLSVTPVVAGGTLTVDAGACRFQRGDANRDAVVDISDVVTVLIYLFRDGAGLMRCEDAGDANDDGALDIADPIRILGRLFADGPPLPPPYPGCGTDPTVDTLRCGVSVCE